jgi:hypothetical protein
MKKPRFGAFFVKLVMQSLLKHDCYCYLRVTDYSACGLVNRWGRIPPSKARAIRGLSCRASLSMTVIAILG